MGGGVNTIHPLASPSSLRQLGARLWMTADWRRHGKPHVYETNGCGKIRIGFVLGSFFDKYHIFNQLKQFGATSFLCFCTGFFQLSLSFSPVDWLLNPIRISFSRLLPHSPQTA
jgi:hypothetical protein